jgi:hypothetical protein
MLKNKMIFLAGYPAIRFHFFPERRGLREAMVVSSTPTSRFSESRGACQNPIAL